MRQCKLVLTNKRLSGGVETGAGAGECAREKLEHPTTYKKKRIRIQKRVKLGRLYY